MQLIVVSKFEISGLRFCSLGLTRLLTVVFHPSSGRLLATNLLCVTARDGVVHQQMFAPHLEQIPRPVVHRSGGSVVRTILAGLQAGRARHVAHAVPDARAVPGPRRGSSSSGIIGDCGLCEGLWEEEEEIRLVIGIVFDGRGSTIRYLLSVDVNVCCWFSYEIVFDWVTTLKKVVPCGATLELFTWEEVQINNRLYSFDPDLKATL